VKDLRHHTGLTTALRRLSASVARVPLVPSEARFSRPGWVRGVEGSGQREPSDLASLRAGVRISNRHSCRLETTLSPCVPTNLVLLIVTQMPLFSARTPPPKQRRPAGSPSHSSLTTRLSAVAGHFISDRKSNRGGSELEFLVSDSKQRAAANSNRNFLSLPVSRALACPDEEKPATNRSPRAAASRIMLARRNR
jgi:hypothetical protein